jgi:hypothetical protein
VRDQDLSGATDEALFSVFGQEEGALVTFGHDFGHVLGFPPELGPGVVVLEPGTPATPQSLVDRLREMLTILATNSFARSLWVVEPGRVRIHLRRGED